MARRAACAGRWSAGAPFPCRKARRDVARNRTRTARPPTEGAQPVRDSPAMSSQDTRALITQAIEHFSDEVPALKQLKLVIRLELRARGGDVPIWRVELPGPEITQ